MLMHVASQRPAADRIGRLSSVLVLCTAVAALLSIFGIFAFILYASRLDVAAAARTASGNLVVAVSQQLARDVEMLDLSLQDLADGIGNPDVSGLPPRLRKAVLFDRVANGHGALLFIDANGRLADQAGVDGVQPIDFSQDAFFKIHASRDDVGLYVSEPFVSVIDGETSLALSRRVTRAGAFAGVAVATIKLSAIKAFFATLDLGPNGSASLAADNGTLLLRQPFVAAAVGLTRVSPAVQAHLGASGPGAFDMVSGLDGVHRRMAYAPVAKASMTVLIGQSVEDIYAAWWRRARLTGLAMLLLGNLMLGLIGALQVALRRRQAAEEALEALARTDKLTGLANRRSFDETLERQWAEARRRQQPLALLLLDIDFFKAINDSLGHQGGDAVLATIGTCIAEAARDKSDFVARYGGEEFAILLPDTIAQEALAVAHRIEGLVGGLEERNPRSATGFLTVSIGVAVLVPEPQTHPARLVHLADLSLYDAKRAGRNRIVLGRERDAA